MTSVDIPILVVDDAKFSSTVVSKALRNAGYTDVRIAHSAGQALQMIAARPAHILIADWLMPTMDGLELAAKTRQIDTANNHCTYIILLTAKEGSKVLVNAFDKGVDDFINKSSMSQQLLPRVYAAGRLVSNQNALLQENTVLRDNNSRLRKYTTIDPLTGLGNKSYARARYAELCRHHVARGGVTSVGVIEISGFDSIRSTHSKRSVGQLVAGVGRRLGQIVRPIDVVIRLEQNQFMVLSERRELGQINSRDSRRINQSISVKAYKTSAGFVSIDTRMVVLGIDPKTMASLPFDDLLNTANEGLVNTTSAEPVVSINEMMNVPADSAVGC